MSDIQPKNPLHGVTLEMVHTDLVEHSGWEAPGQTINIKCFIHDNRHKIQPEIPAENPLGQGESGRLVFAQPGLKRLKRL